QTTLSRVELGQSIQKVGGWGWTAHEQALADRVYAGCDGSSIDPPARALIVDPAPSRAFARRDIIGDCDWYSSRSYAELRKPIGVDDAVYTKNLLSAKVLATIAVCRAPGDRPFTEEDRNLIHVLSDEYAVLCDPEATAARTREAW